MQTYEFKVVPAPRRGEKSRDAKTVEDRFALALTTLMNKMARDGWSYLRAETLPCDERSGFTGTRTGTYHLLVFRRPMPPDTATLAPAPRLGPATEAPSGPAPAIKRDP